MVLAVPRRVKAGARFRSGAWADDGAAAGHARSGAHAPGIRDDHGLWRATAARVANGEGGIGA